MHMESDESESPLFIDCPILVTERLLMRPPHEDDVPDLVALANNRRIAEMLGRMPHPYGEAEARAFVAHAARRREVVYAIAEADTGRFIGCAGLNPASGNLDLGYWIGQPFWGRGYATEASQALVDLAFRATAIAHLTATCRVTNAASRRVIHKCGFQYSGQGMQNSVTAGQVPIERYRLDRRTWVGLKSWSRDP